MLVHTYSIVARHPETGEIGGAVQSHWFSVGSVVLWGEAGVGVVATQSLVDISYGPLGLELLRAGRTPDQALRALTAADEGAAVRQAGIVDARGRTAAHTGARCIPMAGHRVGEGYSAQANLMERDTVWGAMAEAFEAARGDLVGRLLAALRAAQDEGGDIRGAQSAAVLVLAPEGSGRPWEDRRVDLRVEDHPDPVAELERLVGLHRAYRHMNAGDQAIEAGDVEKAVREYGAAEELVPENPEMPFWHAVSLANAGRLDEALPLFRRAFEGGARWEKLAGRLAEVNLLEVSGEAMAQILGRQREP